MERDFQVVKDELSRVKLQGKKEDGLENFNMTNVSTNDGKVNVDVKAHPSKPTDLARGW